MAHSPEPWEAFHYGEHDTLISYCVASGGFAGKEDAERAVACVNAMQGIEDPAAFVAEAKAREALFRFSRQDWRDVAEQCKEALRKTWDAGIVPINPDDLRHQIDYGDGQPPIVHG